MTRVKPAASADSLAVSRTLSPRSDAAPAWRPGFAKLTERAGEAAEIGFKVYPHMLRHATGYKLANDGSIPEASKASFRSRQHPAHGPLPGVDAGPLPRLLEKLNPRRLAAQRLRRAFRTGLA